ncbi:MAG: homoserine dehydrogenase [Desulfobacterales bacterium]|nr:homoserine dehydrogenase [Desulfobacterales bacterium]
MAIEKKIILCGFGNVGRAFTRLLDTKQEELQARYDLQLRLAGVVDIGGAAVDDIGPGLPPGRLTDFIEAGGVVEAFETYGRPGLTALELIAAGEADILVETTPTNLQDAEPARSHFMAAIAGGLDIIAANKGPLVRDYRRILDRAREKGVRIGFSAATAAALPTLDVGQLCTAGARIEAIEGILNGTTNYILTRMAREGCAYEDALHDAQALGIAETNPTLDVEGLDTRNKIVVIANTLFDLALDPGEVETVGITGVSPADMAAAREAGEVIKLIGSARRTPDGPVVKVAPEALPADHPLAGVNLSEKGISYATDTMGRITVTGGHSSPTGAAAAMLKDIIHMVKFKV